MFAARNNHTKVVKSLLEAGADVNAKNADGQTALSLSSSKDIAKLLKNAEAKK